MKKEIILALILVGTTLISGCVTKEASDNVPFIEDAVIKELETQNEVRVSLMLRENDKIKEIMSRERTKGNRAEINKELMKSIDEIQSEVLSSLSDSEFRIRHKSESTPTLSGYITKEGLNKLKNNPHIERIALVRTTQAS